MRPFEYHALNYYNLLNERISSSQKSIGLLCSFREKDIGDNKIKYDGNTLKSAIDGLCTKLKWKFDVIGEKQNSLDWMSAVLKLIIKNDYLIVDVTDPRPNVMYELGIACSYRDSDSVIITNNINVSLDSSEVLQLQCLRYKDNVDLVEKLYNHFNINDDYGTIEEETQFQILHRKLSPGAMLKLYSMFKSHQEHFKKNPNAWHIAFDTNNPSDLRELSFAEELIKLNLAYYDYGKCKKQGVYTWAMHPTELGKRYIKSDYFLNCFLVGDYSGKYEKTMSEIQKNNVDNDK